MKILIISNFFGYHLSSVSIKQIHSDFDFLIPKFRDLAKIPSLLILKTLILLSLNFFIRFMVLSVELLLMTNSSQFLND